MYLFYHINLHQMILILYLQEDCKLLSYLKPFYYPKGLLVLKEFYFLMKVALASTSSHQRSLLLFLDLKIWLICQIQLKLNDFTHSFLFLLKQLLSLSSFHTWEKDSQLKKLKKMVRQILNNEPKMNLLKTPWTNSLYL